MIPCRSQQMLRGEGAFKVVTRLGGHEAVTSEQGEEELDHDTILHIFRCVDEDSDEFVNPDDLMKQVCIRGIGGALTGYVLVDSFVSLPSLTERRLQFKNLEVKIWKCGGLGGALTGYVLVDSFVSWPSLTERRLQFENLEVRPKRADVEQMYHQHANVSLPGGTNKVCEKPAPSFEIFESCLQVHS